MLHNPIKILNFKIVYEKQPLFMPLFLVYLFAIKGKFFRRVALFVNLATNTIFTIKYTKWNYYR
jgi:hypothetical protein